MTQHTPGPWRVDDRFTNNIINEDDTVTVCRISSDGGFDRDKEALANANLIAAAPSLLESGEKLLDEINQTPGHSHWGGYDEFVAAVAEAKGAQS